MRAPAYLDQPTIPISYLQLMVELLAERGIRATQLLAGLPVAESLLEQPHARMSAIQWTRVVLRARELTQDPGLGYAYGLRMRPTVHGLVGYAAMSAADMLEATKLVVRYAGVRQAHFRAELELSDDVCQLSLRERFPILVMRTFFYENILLGFARGFAALLGRDLDDFTDYQICFDSPEPPYYREWRDRLPRTTFLANVNAVRFPRSYLSLRPALADPHASQQALLLCERELALASEPSEVSALVCRELSNPARTGFPTLPEIAARLSLSTRTLKRRLQEEQTSFLRLLNETRQREAADLLVRSDLTVQEIGVRLGYENPANFSRAFTHWTGETPTAYRARARNQG